MHIPRTNRMVVVPILLMAGASGAVCMVRAWSAPVDQPNLPRILLVDGMIGLLLGLATFCAGLLPHLRMRREKQFLGSVLAGVLFWAWAWTGLGAWHSHVARAAKAKPLDEATLDELLRYELSVTNSATSAPPQVKVERVPVKKNKGSEPGISF
ncbi:MAG: hypothetical protein NTW03_16090 [Verrucomicrobia bacterium]|nr:hypothetical protein [Verrucomicrobiota bacterium]